MENRRGHSILFPEIAGLAPICAQIWACSLQRATIGGIRQAMPAVCVLQAA